MAVAVLPGGEIVPALDRGVIDGSDWAPLVSANLMGFPDVAKQVHYPGWTRPVHLLELIVGATPWNKLEPGAQRGVEAACLHNLRRSLENVPEIERQGAREAQSRGVSVQPYPPAVLNSVRSATQQVLDDMARQDPNFARVLSSYNTYR
jgi:TRAP-type mannitol/chloroaromatic compound transport system substrate-binding protein